MGLFHRGTAKRSWERGGPPGDFSNPCLARGEGAYNSLMKCIGPRVKYSNYRSDRERISFSRPRGHEREKYQSAYETGETRASPGVKHSRALDRVK